MKKRNLTNTEKKFGNWYGEWDRRQEVAMLFAIIGNINDELSETEQLISTALKEIFSYQTNYACVPLYKQLIEDLRRHIPLEGMKPWEEVVKSFEEAKEVEIVAKILKDYRNYIPLDIGNAEWDFEKHETLAILDQDQTIVLVGENFRGGMPLQEFLLWFRGIDDSPKEDIAKWSGITVERQQEVYETLLILFLKKANEMLKREKLGLPPFASSLT